MMEKRKQNGQKKNNVSVRTEGGAVRPSASRGGERARIGFDFSYFFSSLAAIAVALLSVGLVLYFGYHLVKNFTNDVETAFPQKVSETQYREGEGYIIRDEIPVRTTISGTPDYAVFDGERVALGERLCSLYDSLPEDARAQIEAIDREIALLEASIDPGVVSGGLPAATASVSEKYALVMKYLGRGEYEKAAALADSLRAAMNHVEWLVGNTDDLSLRVSVLLGERSELLASYGRNMGTINSSSPGYFFTECDGYEGVFSTKVLDGLTVGSFAELISTERASTEGCVGKLVGDPVWYVAVPLSGEDADGFEAGKRYNVLFSDNKNQSISMKLERVVLDIEDHDSDGDRKEAVLVFSTKEMPRDFEYIRVQNIHIEYATYDGYRVPMSAVHYYKGMVGVYAQNGGYILFRRISPIYEGDGYYIVNDYSTAEPGLPKTYPCLGFSDFGCFDDYRTLEDMAERHGWERKNYDNGGVGVVMGQSLEYYYHLSEHEQMVTFGRELYHGKALN
jgi:hypothetical protein